VALYRLQLKNHTRGGRKASAAQHAAYILRDVTTAQTKAYVEYVLRQSRKTEDYEDLVHAETHNLPGWAQGNALTFFAVADREERVGGRVSRSLEVALPRELPQTSQIALMQDYCTSQFPGVPYLVGLHDSVGASGEPNPHFHVIWSERKSDGYGAYTSDTFFKQPPQGPGKDRLYNAWGWLSATRQAWADLANVSLEQHGITTAYVDPRSLAARGIERPAEPRLSAKETTLAKTHGVITEGWHAVLDGREERKEYRDAEQALAREAWEARKAELLITDVQVVHRAAFVAQVRWRTEEMARNPRPRPTLKEVREAVAYQEQKLAALEAARATVHRAQAGAEVPMRALVAALATGDEPIPQKGLTMSLEEERRHGRS
jgi:MobA/MobL family